MTAVKDPPHEPYATESGDPPPPEVLNLWNEVGVLMDKSAQVIWKKAVDSLDTGNTYLRSSKEARFFLEKYMLSIISILADQQPAKIGTHERNCVIESLHHAIALVANDLEVQIQRKSQSILLESLNVAFNRKRAFYKGSKGNWNVSQVHGLPEVRMKLIDRFRQKGGFDLMSRYMAATADTPFFPKLETINQILVAANDSMMVSRSHPVGTDLRALVAEAEGDALLIAEATMNIISNMNEEALKKIASEMLGETQANLKRIFDRMIVNRRERTYEFYAYWRALALKMIRSQSLPLKLSGWSQVDELIDASAHFRPPPKSFLVTNAGCEFVNGTFEFNGQLTEDGYARPGTEISYVRKIPDDAKLGGGKKLTLFRCTMRSQQKWWFLSEADEEQPGTDRDIDYYQHKSKEHEEAYPPPDGWFTCRTAGVDPPPHLEPVGLMVPPGREFETLEHQLAKWAISNEIVEQVLGDTTIHREVVSRSTPLIKFLAGMCGRSPAPTEMTDGPEAKEYCLQASHLLFAWKTCLRKADAAVSSQVYNLLVSILPLCPSDLAIPLLESIQSSLSGGDDNRDYLFEVSEFCSALATGNVVDNKSGVSLALKGEVRDEALNLVWSVLTNPDASSLRTYDALKRYVEVELRVERKDKDLREKFMKYCIDALANNVKTEGAIDEVHATVVVRLTNFVIDACPHEQAVKIASRDEGSLPKLLFDELRMYLLRRQALATTGLARKGMNSANSKATPECDAAQQHMSALKQRLKTLRQVFGLTTRSVPLDEVVALSYDMIETLWQLCDAPDDRSSLMMFIASASRGGNASLLAFPPSPLEQLLSPGILDSVGRAVFLNLFCSASFGYDRLTDGAYRSFQFLFGMLRNHQACSHEMKRIAVDALWRICLTVEETTVASQARKDLLQVYMSSPTPSPTANGQTKMVTDETDENRFIDRILECLLRARIDADEQSTFRSADRCLRILNAAIGHSSQDGRLMTASTLIRLGALEAGAQIDDVLKCLPHGIRGQAAYRRVGILVKRPSAQAGSKDLALATPRNQSPFRFALDLHPLETIRSVKAKVADLCKASVSAVKLIQISGRAYGPGLRSPGEAPNANLNFNIVPEDTVVDELGIIEGCEIMFVITMPNTVPVSPPLVPRGTFLGDLSGLFYQEDGRHANKLFSTILDILKSLPGETSDTMNDSVESATRTIQRLAWDFLLAMPTNPQIELRVKSVPSRGADETSVSSEDDPMEVDSSSESWDQLLDVQNFDRSVYVLLTIDSLLRPAKETVSILPQEQRDTLQSTMEREASAFRRSFIEAGGFLAVVRFFATKEQSTDVQRGRTRRGSAVALRILKSCLLGNVGASFSINEDVPPDALGGRLLASMSDYEGLLHSLMSMVIDDPGISSSTITDVLRFLRLLLQSSVAAQAFVSLPNGMSERFLAILLMHDEGPDNTRSSAISTALMVRRSTHDLILQTAILADTALPWLVKTLGKIDPASESTSEYFAVLENLVCNGQRTARSGSTSRKELDDLGTMVCKKLASCPRPSSESESFDFPTGVLCGCLKIVRALIEHGEPNALHAGSDILLTATGVVRWSQAFVTHGDASSDSPVDSGDARLIDLMGCVFDGFLTPCGASSVSICCDKESRCRGFEVVSAATRSCRSKGGFAALVARVSTLIDSAAPNLRHRWGQFGGTSGEHNPRSRVSSKYSGLRNQGCTCYMNSVLQQLFMMPELRDSMCSAPLPSRLRTSGTAMTKGLDIVGRKITLQWENGVSYDAIVEAYDENSGAHRVRYCTTQVATQGRYQVDLDEIGRLPPQLPDEFVLSEGRPGKETGVFEISKATTDSSAEGATMEGTSKVKATEETQDEAASRHLLEEVQKTFIHLNEGSRGRCFDPRALVEACACLKLEFDVWQQNDASEFTTKLLDRLEIALKKYAPDHFHFLDHTFGIKVTKQKICKECGLKTNREEKHINIDCQIRGKTDILEALAAMTEDEIMEGSNRVFCDNCKENTDTVLRTAISTLPNVLILSLKRFDLDFNTFETVKLNSRCSFGETLNLKPFTLEGLEAMESAKGPSAGDPMETDDANEHCSTDTHPLDALPNEDYEYKLVGVLVHAGVAQGGHYYSFIKERYPGSEAKWYRFDDEDVTPFDPSCIEAECFGGKVKKETKWPNGTIHTVEQEQFANALILFYEKIKPSDLPVYVPERKELTSMTEGGQMEPEPTTTGYGVFKADVQRSNATHKWQTFLFDSEFQEFMKRVLRLTFEPSEQLDTSLDNSWRQDVVQMTLSFLFDVLLYSSDRSFVEEWTKMLRESLLLDSSCGQSTVRRLAQKTQHVSSNWIRTYLLDCPDPGARSAAACIFGAAIESSLSCDQELRVLDQWCLAWEEQVKTMPATSAAPCELGQQWSALEDVTKLNGKGASGVGVIFSFLNVLLEAMPRCSRFSSELNGFVRDLSCIRLTKSSYEFIVRRAIQAALIPARLVAIVARDSLCPAHYRRLFPGSSISHEAAATQMRHETIHSLVSMAGSHLHNSDTATSRITPHSDYGSLFEALANVAGLPGCTQAPLIHDTGEVVRNRRRYALNEASVTALTEVFEEYCPPGAPGMGHRDIERYLIQTKVDLNQFPPQRIQDILNKYSSPTTGSGVAASRYLSLEGFLAYYRDIIQTNDGRLRHDLTLLGFRNDLSRRSHSARVCGVGDGLRSAELHESVALDVAETLGDQPASWGDIANTCLSNSANIFAIASNVSEQLALYLVAGAAYRRPADDLIDRILQAIYQSSNDWAANDSVGNATLALQVIVHLPDPDREGRIRRIMESSTSVSRNVDHGGVGILPVLRYLYHARHTSQSNRNELQWNYMRYADIFKKLRKSQSVFLWLNANRDGWHQLERDLIDSSSHQLYRHQQYQQPIMQQQLPHLTRGGSEVARDGGLGVGQGGVSVPLDHGQSDSDLNGMNDSEDDDDSQYEELGDHMSVATNEGPHQIVVTGAGNQAVNGIYRQDGYFQDACKYVMEGRWNGTQNRFYIFCCNVSNNTKHWYISIVPVGSQPGTSNDIDFYTAPVHERSRMVPPREGWTKAQHGEDGVPTLEYRMRPEDVGITSSQIYLIGDRESLGNGNGGGGGSGSGFVLGDEDDDDDQNERYYEEMGSQSPVVQGFSRHEQENQNISMNEEDPKDPNRLV